MSYCTAEQLTHFITSWAISSCEPAFVLVSKRNPDSGLYRFESLQFTDFQSFQLYADRLTIENEQFAHAQKSEQSAKSAFVATNIVIHTMLAALSTPE